MATQALLLLSLSILADLQGGCASAAAPRLPKRRRHVLEGPFLNDSADGEVFSPKLVLSEALGSSTGEWTGHKVWPSAVVLLKHLYSSIGGNLKGLRILELGCGLPLLGASLAALGAEVCSTDHPDMLPYVKDALTDETASATLTGLSSTARARLRLRPLEWGGDAEALQQNVSKLCNFTGPVDLVIGADLVYDKFPVEALQETLVSVLRSSRASAVFALQPRRFPQASYLSDPQKISGFLRRLAGQPGDWEVRIDRPTAEAGLEDVVGMVIATVVPAGARKIEQCANVRHAIHYSKEELLGAM